MNQMNSENFSALLAAFLERNFLSVRRVASALNCSEATLARLLAQKTWPTQEMLRQSAVLIEIGFERYCKLSKAEREKISQALGTVGGGSVGFASVTAVVSALGSVGGLSAAGITSGLAAMGSIVGGGMMAGVALAAAMPMAAAGAGYGIVCAAKRFASQRRLNQEDLDTRWEIIPPETAQQRALPL